VDSAEIQRLTECELRGLQIIFQSILEVQMETRFEKRTTRKLQILLQYSDNHISDNGSGDNRRNFDQFQQDRL
jgi:hypothetical protein